MKCVFCIPLFLLLPFFLWTEDLTFRIPRPSEGGHEYFPTLLESAFSSAGHRINLVYVDADSPSQIRQLLQEGELDLVWFLASPEFTKNLVRIPFNLTKGLGGHFLLLLPRSSPHLASLVEVRSLSGLRDLGLTAGTLAGSRESEVWKANRLGVTGWEGSAGQLAEGLSDREGNFDYLPVSLLSVPWELKNHPGLTEDQGLLVIIPEDYRFYLSGKNLRWESLILDSLEKADRNGTLEALLNRTFKTHNQKLNLVGRQKIFLTLP